MTRAYHTRIADKLAEGGLFITASGVAEVERELERERKGETVTAQIGQEAAATRSMDSDAVFAALLGNGLRVRLRTSAHADLEPIECGGCAPPVLAAIKALS